MTDTTPSPSPAGNPQGIASQEPADLGDGAPTGPIATRPVGAFTIEDSGTSVPTRAMEDVLAERWRQIHEFGHTPQEDARRSIGGLYDVVRRYVRGLGEYASHHKTPDARASMRRYAVKLAAALLAFIDRLDAEEAG